MTDQVSSACRRRRCAALIAAGVLLPLPVLAGCSGDDASDAAAGASQDIAPAARERLKDGGTLRWAVDTMPGTLNAFQADADATTTRITGAVLPTLFTLDERGRPQRNADYLDAADITARDPKQVVTYKINPKARWSDGRRIGAADFLAQWKALRGRDNAYWTARNAGYDRIAKVAQGAHRNEVKVTFARPYADWRSLFSPLYPKSVMGDADAFNDGTRERLKVAAGPFMMAERAAHGDRLTLVRNPRWWGARAKLDRIVFTELPRERRAAALAAGAVDVAEVDQAAARKVASAGHPAGSGAKSGADAKPAARTALRGYTVRKALEPAYTQLALNGSTGPLSDERVRRAVARAIDRQALADTVLKPLSLPASPLGSHLLLAGQEGYEDHSDAVGGPDADAARSLLADAGWKPGGLTQQAKQKPHAAAPSASGAAREPSRKRGATDGRNPERPGHADRAGASASGAAVQDYGPGARPAAADAPLSAAGAVGAEVQRSALLHQSAALYKAEAAAQEQAGATTTSRAFQRRAARALGAAERIETGQDTGPAAARPIGAEQGRADEEPAHPVAAAQVPADDDSRAEGADSRAKGAPHKKTAVVPALRKNGKPLTLRFVLPDGANSEQLRTVGERISAMLAKVGIQTSVQRVADAGYFQDHIAAGDYDLALYSWPGTAYPATDARPIYAKPEPAADGSLTVEQNYTRVGTDHIDQLFEQAASELDQDAAEHLMAQADARIWAVAGSIPLYQRPELVATRKGLANIGAFGFASPRFQDIGYTK
ncbi:ABC transporter family substrate-binding protein [Streptomyces gilvosporeus]|uniref:ABC transporter substrate-binding protein n=1 Tax=Streptomyces gilvosporeus TaxID=553510 RepID=A0A1V0TWC8_9ACTN|nr:ABC transporter family substrate-binding protein [Streptomyces gilvosporeus]ARF57223.1 ABC transporter substrate-binding protein [Streptomyces gilvosporeus]